MINCDRYVIWGSGGHAKVLADIIKLRGGSVVALFDNNQNACSCLLDVPLLYGLEGFKRWLDKQGSLKRLGAAIAIGGARGKERQELAEIILTAGLDLPAIIHPTAAISESAQVGDGCQILANAVVAADASIGDSCIINNSANVDHECRLGNGVHIAPGAVICGCVTVADNAMIGAGAVVLPRLRIGAGALVGAGAVVTNDVQDGMIVIGNPAKIVKGEG